MESHSHSNGIKLLALIVLSIHKRVQYYTGPLNLRSYNKDSSDSTYMLCLKEKSILPDIKSPESKAHSRVTPIISYLLRKKLSLLDTHGQSTKQVAQARHNSVSTSTENYYNISPLVLRKKDPTLKKRNIKISASLGKKLKCQEMPKKILVIPSSVKADSTKKIELPIPKEKKEIEIDKVCAWEKNKHDMSQSSISEL